MDDTKDIKKLLPRIKLLEEQNNQLKSCKKFGLVFEEKREYLLLPLNAGKYQFNNNIYKYIAKAKCLVLFSTYEGMPNVVLEAMACNTGVIISNFEGYKDIIEDKLTGFVVENRNVPMLSEKIYEMINQNEHREKMQEKAFQFISEMNRNSQEKYIEIMQ